MHDRRHRFSASASGVLVAGLFCTVQAAAQQITVAPEPSPTVEAGILGRVSERGGRPIADAEVVDLGTGLSARTDANGRFARGGFGAGAHMLLVRRVGYAPVTLSLSLRPGERREFNAELDPRITQLPELQASGPLPPRYADLARRLRLHRGVLVTYDELHRSARFSDVIQLRGPLATALAAHRGDALPLAWLNGGANALSNLRNGICVSVNGSQPTQQVGPDDFRTNAVEAVELLSPTDARAEWPGLVDGCSVMVVWF